MFFSSYFFLKYVVFGGKLFTFFITYSLQVLLYFVQYVHVNNVSFIRSLLYTEKYRDFFLYKFDNVRSEGSYVLVYFLGYVGILIEKLFFLFFFIFFMVYDFCIVVFYKLL